MMGKLENLKQLKKAYLQQMFPQEGEDVPRLRFSGFTEPWEHRKLGEVVKIFSGWSPSEFDIAPDELFIKVDDLNYSYRTQNDSQLKVKAHNKYTKIKSGSTIFAKRGAAIMTNKVRMLGRDAYMDTNMMSLEPTSIAPDFLYSLIANTRLFKIADTSTIPQINNKHIEPYDFNAPAQTEEQVRIGTFFRTLDNAIALCELKLESLRELKKACLQLMFPQEGENVPRLRFAGFAEPWERRKLGEVADIVAGGDIDKSKLLSNGKYPVIANALTNDGVVGYYENYYRIEAPAVTVTGRGDVGFAQARKINFTPTVRLLSVKSNIDVDFLANAINQFNVFVESTGVPQLTSPQLAHYEVVYPDKKEQTAIGNFFRTLDELIQLHS
jgi:type I restriction enzyme S subunit